MSNHLIKFIKRQWRAYQKQQRRQAYRDYLRSEDWKHVRRLKLEFAGHRCEKCGATDELHVHHLTYDRFGHENLTDLQVLCRDCHETVHGRKFGIGYPERDMRIEHENLGY